MSLSLQADQQLMELQRIKCTDRRAAHILTAHVAVTQTTAEQLPAVHPLRCRSSRHLKNHSSIVCSHKAASASRQTCATLARICGLSPMSWHSQRVNTASKKAKSLAHQSRLLTCLQQSQNLLQYLLGLSHIAYRDKKVTSSDNATEQMLAAALMAETPT